MPKLVQINVSANVGSHGVIAEEIGQLVQGEGWGSTIAYGRRFRPSQSRLIRIGTDRDVHLHGVKSRLFDNHGLASKGATFRLIQHLEELQPDIVHLHNIHGYYLNYKVLFEWLRLWGGPVVWTLHDCWSFTGHCAHFMGVGCQKWLTECHDCELRHAYPASLFIDRSRQNFRDKREAFTSLGDKLHIVSCSDCVADYARQSFFKDTDIQVIHNGIDLHQFQPTGAEKRNMILGVASVWPKSKGLGEFIKLRELLPSDTEILLVGLSPKQIKSLPEGIKGITRTANRQELADLYSQAAVFVNPTFEDNFPTVNLEALACGTPVVTYRTGGSPEAVTPQTGVVVEQGDVQALADAILQARSLSTADCRAHAEAHFNKDDRYREYLDLYRSLCKEAYPW